MALQHTINIIYSTDAGAIASGSVPVTNNSSEDFDYQVPVSTVKEWDVTITAANIASMMLFSDKAVTVKTNSTGSPANTFNLTANTPLVWNSNFATPCPITTDITKIYWDNGAGLVANVKARFLVNRVA